MIRQAVVTDIDTLVMLERQHGRDELGTDQVQLDAQLFGHQEFKQLIESEVLMVAENNGQIVGYAMVASARFFGKSGFYRRFFQRVECHFNDEGERCGRIGCYGPVWIAPIHRGKGFFKPLIESVFQQSCGHFDTLATFIAEENEHSLNAHVKGAGMQVIDFFEDEGRGFYLLLKK